MNRPKIAFLGMGLMGLPMAQRLLADGYDVTVWNRSAEKCQAAVQAGAKMAPSPAEAANACDVVLMCLMDAAAVEKVVFGPSGVASAMRAPDLLVDFSSIHPQATKDLAQRLASDTGTLWLDAPVSGSTPAAQTGTLTIMVGGSDAGFAQANPILDVLAQNVTHMGPTGAGQMTKLVNQILSGCTMVLVAEAVHLAEEAGIDATRLAPALAGGFADSKPFQLLAPRMSGRAFDDPLGTVASMQKDLATVCDVGTSVGAKMPMTHSALRLLQDTSDGGNAESDISTVILAYKRDG